MTESEPVPDQPSAEPPEVREVRLSAVPVVAIGASAGGLQALRTFFSTVTSDTGVAFVVVVHLAPDRESHLADILQPNTIIPVTQVTEPILLEPNQAYVIPPGYNLSAIDSHVRTAPLETDRRDRAPVDHFFRTLSETHDGRSIGVILSGTGTDGADGVRHIRGHGGLVVVQDPSEAEYDGMVRSALLTGLVDVVAPVADMMDHIQGFLGTHPLLPSGDGALAAERPDTVQQILTVVRLRTGQDFLRYKRTTVGRRIARRMQVLGVERLNDYLGLLRDNPREAGSLLDDLVVNVTGFFRDPEVFQALEAQVIPSLFAGKGPSDAVRVWSVGCSTGEEAYSLGMLLLDESARRGYGPQIQVFASDLHERSLRYAREGLYPEAAVASVPAERLERFFRREEGGYRVHKELRDTMVFAVHNVLQDPPFSRLDLIVCRNLLIYLQTDVQREVAELFHYALRSDGMLLLGTAEALDRTDLFRLENKEHHLYRRRDAKRVELRLPAYPPGPGPRALIPLRAGPSGVGTVSPPRPEGSQHSGALHQRMVEQYAPPSLLMDEEHNAVHLSEHVGRYLQYPGGEPTTNVFKLVREEFRIELRAAVHSARAGDPARSRPISLMLDGVERQVVLRVRRADDKGSEGFILVIFDELDGLEIATEASGGQTRGLEVELEAELELTRNRLQAVIEEFETSQEEMRASNEELQSANEELRSTMEELETSREELQSINEELQTLNQENKHRVEELSQLSNDLQNLLEATDVATLFLDRSLRILRFTPRVGEIFNVRRGDRGRPLADLTHHLAYDGLIDDARRVLQGLVPIEREIASDNGDLAYIVRLTPYRTMEDRIEGVVITLVDLTAVKRSEAALRETEDRFRTVVNLVPDLVWETDPDGAVTWYNDRWYSYTGMKVAQAMGYGWSSAIHPDDLEASRAAYSRAVIEGTPLRREHRIRSADGTYRWFLVRAEPLRDPLGRTLRWFGTATDIHDQRLTLEEVERQVADRTEALGSAHAALQRVAAADALRVALTDSLRPIDDPITIQAAAARVLRQHLRAGRALYAEIEPDGTAVVYETATDGLGDMAGRHDLRALMGGLLPELAAGRLVVVSDIATDPRLAAEARTEHARWGVRSEVLAPLVRGGHTLSALLAVHQAEPRSWTREELALIEEVAARTGDAVERGRAHSERNALRRQLARAEEDERRRLARELHDQLGQHLTAIALGLDQTRGLVPTESPAQTRLVQLEEQARNMARQVAVLALQLRPPELDDMGLVSALQTFTSQWSLHYGVPVELEVGRVADADLPAEVATAVYRIVQEALTNVAKHAASSQVSVILERRDGSLRLVIEDDGAGFDLEHYRAKGPAQRRFGLAGIRERAELLNGSLNVESSQGSGTTLYVHLPVDHT